MRIAEYDANTGAITYREETEQERAEREARQKEGEKEESEIIRRASKTLAKNEYFYLDGQLCKAKTSIANGAILTLNTNYQVTNVEEELTKLNA